MCRHCVLEVRPERSRVCLDTGAYLINFKHCAGCERRGPVDVHEREYSEIDEDDVYEENVEFKHSCSDCGHVIADHSYLFTVRHSEAGRVSHEYMMECVLCGRGEDTSHVVNDVQSINQSIQSLSNGQSIDQSHHVATISRLVVLSSTPILDPAAVARADLMNQTSDEVHDSEWD